MCAGEKGCFSREPFLHTRAAVATQAAPAAIGR